MGDDDGDSDDGDDYDDDDDGDDDEDDDDDDDDDDGDDDDDDDDGDGGDDEDNDADDTGLWVMMSVSGADGATPLLLMITGGDYGGECDKYMIRNFICGFREFLLLSLICKLTLL